MSGNDRIVDITGRDERPLQVVFVRHAEAEGASITDSLGPKLTQLGQRQAARVAKRFSEEKFAHIYSSTLLRAYDTAKAIAKFHPRTHLTTTDSLREISNYNFLQPKQPLKAEIEHTIEKERAVMRKFITDIRARHATDSKILIVAHGNLIRCMPPLMASRDPRKCLLIAIGNTGVTVVDVWPSGEAVIRLANCLRHLLDWQVT